MEYCTLRWPDVQARVQATHNKPSSVKVGGKRKSASPHRSGKSAKTSDSGGTGSRLSDEQKAKNIADGLCHLCGEPGHFSRECPKRKVPWKNKNKSGKKDFA